MEIKTSAISLWRAGFICLCTVRLVVAAPIAFQPYPAHPRLFFRETGDAEHVGRTDLLKRVRDAENWKPLWGTVILPWCQKNHTFSNEALLPSQGDASADKVFTLALAGWLENNTAYKRKAIDAAIYITTLSFDSITDSTKARWRVMALSLVYDILHEDPYMGASKLSTIGKEIIALCDKLSNFDTEHVGGHSHGDQAVQLIGMCAIAGEISGWEKPLEEALNFWYAPGVGFMETLRHYCSDGGHLQGSWYGFLVAYHDLWLFSVLTNSTLNIRPFADEPWIRKIPEWYLNTEIRGDGDMFNFADTARSTHPFFHNSSRSVVAILADRLRDPQMRWMYDYLDARGVQNGDARYAPNQPYDVVFLDKAKVSGLAPGDARPGYQKARLFSPPGSFFFRDSWDYPASTIVHINAESHFTFWHQHLDSGYIQISWKDDMVLLGRGIYASGNTVVGGEHHRNWYQRSIAHSGVPLIFNPSEVYERYSKTSNDPADRIGNDGGQHWKKYQDGAVRKSVPYNVQDLLQEGGGRAWKKGGFTGMEEESDYVYLHADIAPAYLKEYDEPPRVKLLECQWLILKSSSRYPIILSYHRIESANAAWRKAIPWHFSGLPTVSSGRIAAHGYKGKGKCVIDVLHPERYSFTTIGGGPLDENGYGVNDFRYGGESWAPDVSTNDRNLSDLGKYRVEVSPRTQAKFDEFVTLVMPMGVGDSPPSYNWIDEPDWYGLEIGGQEYRLSKHGNLVTRSSGSTPIAQVIAITPSPARVGEIVTFKGKGVPRNGLITAHSWRSSLDGVLSDKATFTTTRLTRGIHQIHFSVQEDGHIWSSETQRLLSVNAAVTAHALVLDDGQSGTSFTGKWSRSSGANPYGSTSLFARNGATYSYRFGSVDPGRHGVYAWWTGWPGRSTSVPFEIQHAGGTSQVSVNQQEGGGKWNLLGNFSFSTSAAVRIVAQGTATTCADAICLLPEGAREPPPRSEVIADDGAPGTSSTGNWRRSGGRNPYGSQSLYASGGSTYTFRVPAMGENTVYLWWTEWPSRSTRVPISIIHAGGLASVTSNQQADGGKWIPVGSFGFTGEAVITIKAVGDATTCADAVRIVPVP